jgi:tripartite-type tricarboxylate transporter receptor subunit TctC
MTKLTRRTLLAGIAAAPLAAPMVARGQGGPVMRFIVPFPPGGTVDPIARMAQPGMQEKLGATIVVENRPGASGSIGAAQVAKAAPDGNTWLFVFDTHAANPFLMKLPFDTQKDLAPVMLIGTAPYLLATHPSKPYNNFADVVKASKAKPGSVSYATVGAGSIGHLAMVMLGKRAGIDITHIPYRGGGPAMADALGGQVETIIGSAALVTPQVRAGKLKGILSTGAKPLAALPNVQTAQQAGFDNFETYAWWGVFAPGGTPRPVIDRFANALREVLGQEKTSKQLSEAQQIEMILGGPDELQKFFTQQVDTWGPVIKQENIKADQ